VVGTWVRLVMTSNDAEVGQTGSTDSQLLAGVVDWLGLGFNSSERNSPMPPLAAGHWPTGPGTGSVARVLACSAACCCCCDGTKGLSAACCGHLQPGPWLL
jgi:hypothetical protein